MEACEFATEGCINWGLGVVGEGTRSTVNLAQIPWETSLSGFIGVSSVFL
jgi:hypothetical protein